MSARMRLCESCAQPADVRLRDGSYWCLQCNMGALNLGYDRHGGTLLQSLTRRLLTSTLYIVAALVGIAGALWLADVGGWPRALFALLIVGWAVLVLRNEAQS